MKLHTPSQNPTFETSLFVRIVVAYDSRLKIVFATFPSRQLRIGNQLRGGGFVIAEEF